MAESKKRKRPSAKEARARMARAVSAPSPISRAEEEPDGRAASSGEVAEDGRSRDAKEEGGKVRRKRGDGRRESSSVGKKLVRLSVDVPRAQHRFLRVEAAQAETTGMAVVRALISEMEADEGLAERVRDRLGSE